MSKGAWKTPRCSLLLTKASTTMPSCLPSLLRHRGLRDFIISKPIRQSSNISPLLLGWLCHLFKWSEHEFLKGPASFCKSEGNYKLIFLELSCINVTLTVLKKWGAVNWKHFSYMYHMEAISYGKVWITRGNEFIKVESYGKVWIIHCNEFIKI